MKVCEDCKNWLTCENISKPCEKWEPDLCKKHFLYGYIDGYNAARKGYNVTLSEAYARLSEVAGWLSEHRNETQKEKKEMKEDRYSVVNDNGKIAEHMTLEIAGTLVQALCDKWQNEEVTTIFIAREPVREEAWEEEDDD